MTNIAKPSSYNARLPGLTKHVSFRVAVLITCFNRYDITRENIRTFLNEANELLSVKFNLFLLDDASPDQTGSRIIAEWPSIKLVHGDGTLFWNRGMHKLISHARATAKYDAFLFFNDDVGLLPKRLAIFFETYQDLILTGVTPVLAGAMFDRANNVLSYSGMRRTDLRHPLRLSHIEPDVLPTRCDAANGNLLLIPQAAMMTVDNLDYRYRHGLGDIDICYRASKAGYPVFLAPGLYGICSRNDIARRVMASYSLTMRCRFYFGPKNDVFGKVAFFKKHSSRYWIFNSAKMIFHTIFAIVFPDLLCRLRR